MLRKIASLPLRSLHYRMFRSFSSSEHHSPAKETHHHEHSHEVAHHDEHHHTDYSVKIDQDATWLRYRADPKLIYFTGLEETHITLRDYDFSDAYEHLKNKPKLSPEWAWYTDPWRHDDAHDPLAADGDQGYYSGQDPLESRYLTAQGAIVSCIAFVGIIFLYEIMDPSPVPQAELYKSRVTRQWVQSQLEQKNRTLNELRARQREIVQQISSKREENDSE